MPNLTDEQVITAVANGVTTISLIVPSGSYGTVSVRRPNGTCTQKNYYADTSINNIYAGDEYTITSQKGQISYTVTTSTAATSDVMGVYDYADLATQTVPLNYTSGTLNLTNDKLGSSTNTTYKINGGTDLWNPATGLFDWTSLNLGSRVGIRMDIVVTTSTPNQNVILALRMAVGGSSYDLPVNETPYKLAGAHQITEYTMVYMGDNNTRNNGSRFILTSDAACTVKVNGWALDVLNRT